MNITDSIIPPDSTLAHHLLKMSDAADDSTWEIARITNDLIDELDGVHMPDGTPVTRKEVYRAVATRCKGRKPNTIRRWAECVRDYSIELQQQYAGLLSFEHFKVNRRLHMEGFTPSLEYGLAWCIEGNDDKISAGRFRTVGELINQFAPEYIDDSAQAYWSSIKEKLYDKILLIDNDTMREKALYAWRELAYALEEQNVSVH